MLNRRESLISSPEKESLVNSFITNIYRRFDWQTEEDTQGIHTQSHKAKLLYLFLIPLAIFIAVSGYQIVRLTDHANRISNLEQLGDLAIHLSDLTHELQKERGITGIFLSSRGTQFSGELHDQQLVTNSMIDNVNIHIASNNENPYSDLLIREILLAQNELAKLHALRRNVSNFSVNAADAIEYYTNLNLILLDSISLMANESVEPELTRAFLAYVNFLKGKEKTGIERAVLGATFTQDYFSPHGGYQHFIQLIAEQDVYFREFTSLANPSLLNRYNKLTQQVVYRRVLDFREIAHKSALSGGFEVDTKKWFNAITAKIEDLQILENRISFDLRSLSQRLKNDSNREKWALILLMLITATTAIIIGLTLIRNISKSFSQDLYESLILTEHSASGIAVINPESRNILYGNLAFSSMFGHTQEEISKLNFYDFYSSNDAAKVDEVFDKLNTASNTINQIALNQKGGGILTAEITSFPTIIDSRYNLAINVKDIGAKLEAESKLKQSEKTLKTVLDSLDCAVSVIQLNSQSPIYLNKLATDIYNDRHNTDPIWSTLAKPLPSALNINTRNIGFEFSENTYNNHHGKWYKLRNRIISWHNGETVCLRMLDDITTQYKAEQKNKNLLIENRKLSLRNYSLIENERKELAVELHDQLGQLMTGIILQAEFIQRSLRTNRRELIDAASNIVKSVIKIISSSQEITHKLRPILLDQLGLVDALDELTQNWKSINTHTTLDFNATNCPDQLPDDIAICIYRIVQESLTNISKHAKASKVVISLELENSSAPLAAPLLLLMICDDGAGFEPTKTQSGCMGLLNIRERCEALGGRFQLLTKPKKGVNILISVPIMFPRDVACH